MRPDEFKEYRAEEDDDEEEGTTKVPDHMFK